MFWPFVILCPKLLGRSRIHSVSNFNSVEGVAARVRKEFGHSKREPSEVSRSLRAARMAAGMGLADVAEHAGMTKQAVLRIESGVNSNPKIDTLLRIASAVGKSIKIELADAA